MNNAQIEFTKDGYTPELLIIPNNNLGPNSKLSIHLKELKIAQTCQLQDNQLNDIAQGVAESQKLMMKKEYAEVQNLLKNLITRFTGIPTLYILLANTYYLQKDYKQALDYYKKAQFIQPENRIVSRMVEKLSDFDTATRPERTKGAN
jgi:tetratricopeptide (TPR) repeat protein